MPWQKEQSGNPKGRKRLSEEEKQNREEFNNLLKASTTEALEIILDIMRNTRALNRDRISCAKVILERAYGNLPLLAETEDEDNVIEIRIVRADEKKDEEECTNDEWDEVMKELEEENAKCY